MVSTRGVKAMKAFSARALMIILLMSIVIAPAGCTSRENFDVLLYYTKLYALAHGFWEDDGSTDGRVDAMGLYNHIIWGADSRYYPESSTANGTSQAWEAGVRRGSPYEVAVRSVFMVTGFDGDRRFWGY